MRSMRSWATGLVAILAATSPLAEARSYKGINATADTNTLKTWWHKTGEINTETAVELGNVRQSHMYKIRVASASKSKKFYNSFVYESIPRNGNGKICIPGDPTSLCDVDDQISIEMAIGADMAWTQYLTEEDSVVKVVRRDGGDVDPENVIIRPTTLDFKLSTDGKALFIDVPFSKTGYRFSVEFKDNLWEYRNAAPGLRQGYVQNVDPNGESYVEAFDDSMPIVGVEPINALLVFVSPFPADEHVPDLSEDTYEVPQGLVTGLDKVTESKVYFPPGVYWLTGSTHAILSESVTWVHIAPGAYVKGAIEYRSQASHLKATGFGVLSGEQYVYQANTAEGYTNIKSDLTSLRMWSGSIANGAKWTVNGLTTNTPPFNSMDFHAEDLNSISTSASDYKQVGAFFGQTDGIQMYPFSYVHDVFYHVGDDAIKTYYSNVQVERMTVWKTNNAPIVQFGWYSRNISNITVESVEVLHTRYHDQHHLYPRGMIASAINYLDQDSTSNANIEWTVSDYTLRNWRCEGICPNLVGINPLQNIDTMTLENIRIDGFGDPSTQVGVSTFRVFTDELRGNQTVTLGAKSPGGIGLAIKDFYVGGEHITFEADNWDINSKGKIAFDEHWAGNWSLT
nr:4-O-a-D-isomaltooligosaccharylmaltooligosaccharide 1,4-a-isomaltooligosaccharohydrolase [Sarocladium kiliense]